MGTCELVARMYARSPCAYVMPRLPNNGGLYVHVALGVGIMAKLRQVDLFAKYASWS